MITLAKVPQFVDVSMFQPLNIGWPEYKIWSASVDGISRVAIRSSYGYGYKDAHFDTYRAGALAAGIDRIYYYHYCYPSLNKAVDEANYQNSVVGNIRPQDCLVLDIEENVDAATSEWAYQWLVTQEKNYGRPQKIYASTAYIQQRLQDTRLSKYGLWLAKWGYTPDERPEVPFPWKTYDFVQYTDKGTNIPGIGPGDVDVNIFLGGDAIMPTNTIPSGWVDDGTTLKSPDGTQIKLGFRAHILSSSGWDPQNIPLESEQHLTILEQSNPALGPGQRQVFRKTTLEYTEKMGIFEGWPGQEFLWIEKQYKSLLTQVSGLRSQLAASQAQVKDLQTENTQLKALLAASNLGKIGTLAQQIQDDVALIKNLVQVQ